MSDPVSADPERLRQWEVASRLPSVVKRYLTLKHRITYLLDYMDDDVAAAELGPRLEAAETEMKRLTNWTPPPPEPLHVSEQLAVDTVMAGLRRYFPTEEVTVERHPDLGRNVQLIVHAGADFDAALDQLQRFDEEWWYEQELYLHSVVGVHLR